MNKWFKFKQTEFNRQTGFLTKLLLPVFLTVLLIPSTAQNLTRPNIEGPVGLQVNSYTGNLFYQRTDLVVPGRGLSVDLSFSYNSNDRRTNYGFGYGWSFIYNLSYKDSAGGVLIYRSDGRKDYFAPNGGRDFISPKGIFDVLTRGQTFQLTLTSKDGTRYTFENPSHKKLSRIADRNGNLLQFSYSGNNLSSIQDASGRVFNFIFSGSLLQEINSTVGNSARVIKYQYNNAGCLTGVRDALGHIINYAYGPDRVMKTLTDAKKNVVDILYNDNNAVAQINSCLAQKNIHYFPENATVQVLDKTQERTLITTYYFDGEGKLIQKTGNCCGYNVVFGYDAAYNITSIRDANGKTTMYGYDGKGNLLTETDPLGKTIRYTYESSFNQVKTITDKRGNITIFHYDPKGNLTQKDFPLGISLKYTYDSHGTINSFTDGRGKIITYLPNNYGYIEQRTDSVGSSHYTYDGWGNQLSVTDAKGNTTNFLYNEIGQLTQVEDARHGITKLTYDFNGNLETIKDAAGNTKKFSYDPYDRLFHTQGELNTTVSAYMDGLGALLSRTDANGFTSRYTYDNLNRPVAFTNAAGETTNTEYDGNGNKIAIVYPNGNRVRIQYDAANRVTNVQDNLGAIASYTYDANGNKLTETNGVGSTITYQYDELNRLVFKADASGNYYTYEYDKNSNLIKQTDRKGNATTQSFYDALNRPVETVDALGYSIKMAYDAVGNQTSIRDANGNLTRYEFDELNRKTKELFADNTTRQYTYDNIGNLLTRRDNMGQTTSYVYDRLYRLLYRQYPNNVTDSFSYDAGSRLRSAINNAARIEYSYDAANRLLSEKLNGLTTSYTYNVRAGNRTITYPSGRFISRQMDARNQLKNINEGGLPLAQFTYNAAGQNTQRIFANGANNTIAYNGKGLISEYSYAPSHFTDAVYNYDKEDNPVTSTNGIHPNLSEQYNHDKLDQLIDFRRGTQQQAFNFDGVGNRTSATINGTPVSYTPNNMNAYSRIVVGGNTVTPQYDGNGNETFDGRNNYTFDAENRITLVNNGSIAKYSYDARGRRVQKITATDTVNYYYDGLQIIEERNAANNAVATYVWGTWVDDVLSMNRQGKAYYYNSTTNGSVISITDSTGAIAERYEYDGFGKAAVYNKNNALISNSSIGNTYTFSGREYDVETGLYYYRARYYDAVHGRFLQRDPLGYTDGLGLYAYVNNKPFTMYDPLGMEGINWGCYLDRLQTWLDVAGLFPGVGEPFDALNAAIYLTRGQYTNAALSAAAVIPFAGWAATTSKWARKGVGNIDEGIEGLSKFGDEIAEGGSLFKGLGDDLAAGVGTPAAKTGMTDLQLVTRAAQKAETAIGGTGRFAGTAKHTYANNLLNRYQSIYGNRGLQFNQYFNGPAGKGFLDVVNHRTTTIYDYKFGSAVMSNSQFLKYSNSFPGYGIQIIKP